MVTYVIASKATQPFLPECQMLGEYLEENCPDVSVQVVIKSNEDWGEYIDSVCRSYGFYERFCPFIYTLEGEPIGDGADFIEHVRNRYCRASIQMVKEHQDNRARDNLKKIEDLMRQRKQGMTLGEKITSHLEKVPRKQVVTLITDAFFEPYEEQGSVFQLRRTNLQREDGRTVNIVDEIEVEEKLEQEKQAEEEKKDQPFDAFKASMAGHIEGTANNDREAHESQGEDDGEKKSVRKSTISKKKSAMSRTGSQFDGEGSVDNAISKKSSKKSTLDKSGYQNMSLNKTSQEFIKYEIPETCYITMMKKVLIEKMQAKYFLGSHPYPKIEGELIVFKPQKNDQTQGKEVILLRDYSLRKRIETTPKSNYVVDNLAKKTKAPLKSSKDRKDDEEKEAEKEKEPMPNMQCLEVDIEDPLSRDEWNNFIAVVNETEGLGWFQVLPVGQKSSMPLQFNMLHVLPQAKIPIEKLPLDAFVSAQLSSLRKKERSGNLNRGIVSQPQSAREEQENLAVQSGLFMIPEFQFDHCFFQLSEENLVNDPATQIGEVYKRCADFLRLQTRPNSGITCIITPRWFFVGVLTQPYCNAPNGNPVYLDGFDFAGLVSLQTTSESWPATAGLENQTIGIFQAFANSTKTFSILDEMENDKSMTNINEGTASATRILA